MKTRIIKIGNSQGVRIPKVLLEQSGLSAEVELEVQDAQIVIRSAKRPRQGWEEAFRAMAKHQDDRLLGDFRERFSTRLPTGSPASHPVWWGVTFPQRGEARWGVIPQAAVRGRGHRPRVPPSNLPPLGEGKEFVHTVVDHNKGESF